ncbi:MAG: SufD family Fe-S cluster assembly protein [Rhodoferax sp.]|nr:SufD family Fe-S cluster assembly protein [Rhodoferax sp.]
MRHTPCPDLLDAQARLASHGWIRPKAENFRHLPPPPACTWLPPTSESNDPTEGWQVRALNATQADQFITQWLNPAIPAQRSLLFRGLPWPDESDAAHFGWMHRATCQRGLRLHIAGDPGQHAAAPLQLVLQIAPPALFDAPLVVIDVAAGANCVLLEQHAFDPDRTGGVQNLDLHIRLGRGARLRHLRTVAPAPGDRLAHQLHVTLAEAARYDQALLASGSAYHLQRTQIDLNQPRSAARIGAALMVADATLDQQVAVAHSAADTHSAVESLLLASGKSHAVLNAHTLLAPGADDANVGQRLSAIPTSGQPRVVLRPHMEIHHDQVQAAHGATYGALPEEALFYARQRGLDEASALALILLGLQRAVLERALDDHEWLTGMNLDAALSRMTQQHLARSAT